MNNIAHAYVQAVVSRPHLQHATVRVGLWLVGVAEQRGDAQIDMYPSNLATGLNRGDLHIPGVQFRPSTIANALEVLESEGLLRVSEGSLHERGRTSKLFTLTLDS